MLRKSVGSMEVDRPMCSACERTPLVGEFLHEVDPGGLLCGLCLRQLPEEQRAPLSSHRLHAGERGLRVVRAGAGDRSSEARAA